jgi:Leucine-rich repeat (LRR) protein
MKVELRHGNLIGTLPPELALATNLEVISIAGSSGIDVKSQINGSIPLLWGDLLMNLRVLELYDNRLSGRIPSSLWKVSTLEKVSLDGNHLTGLLIPSNVSMLAHFERFGSFQQQSGGNSTRRMVAALDLRRLSLANNLLNGTLSTENGQYYETSKNLICTATRSEVVSRTRYGF